MRASNVFEKSIYVNTKFPNELVARVRVLDKVAEFTLLHGEGNSVL